MSSRSSATFRDNIVICIDFCQRIKTFDKMINFVNKLLANHPEHAYYLYTFDKTSIYHGMISSNKLPPLKQPSDDKQYTHTVFDCIYHHSICRNRRGHGIDKVIIVTDGGTDSAKPGLINGIRKVRCENLEIVLFNNGYDWLHHGDRSVSHCSGLISSLGKYVKSYQVWNDAYKYAPYTGPLKITFMGEDMKYNPYHVIEKILKTAESPKVQWTYDLIASTLYDIGKIMSAALFMGYPDDDDPLLLKIISTFRHLSDRYRYDCNINKMIEYGFNHDNAPLYIADVEYGFVDAKQQRDDFKKTYDDLIRYGTCHESLLSISLPTGTNNKIVICDDESMRCENFDKYPNSADSYGNIHIGLNTCPKMIRLALREFWKSMGNTDYRSCAPMFMITNLMTELFVSGVRLDSAHMKHLRTLAICQTSSSVMIAPEKYDVKSCFDHWKEGKLIPMHFTDGKSHSSLFKDKRINFLNLPEPLWWASVMSMLNIFDAHIQYYTKALVAFGIGTSNIDFMQYLREKQHDSNKRCYVLEKWAESSTESSRYSSSSSSSRWSYCLNC